MTFFTFCSSSFFVTKFFSVVDDGSLVHFFLLGAVINFQKKVVSFVSSVFDFVYSPVLAFFFKSISLSASNRSTHKITVLEKVSVDFWPRFLKLDLKSISSKEWCCIPSRSLQYFHNWTLLHYQDFRSPKWNIHFFNPKTWFDVQFNATFFAVSSRAIRSLRLTTLCDAMMHVLKNSIIQRYLSS